MKYLYPALVFLIPTVSMIGGLAAAPMIAILFNTLILMNSNFNNLLSLRNFKLEFLLLLWLLVSGTWSVNSSGAFIKFVGLVYFFICAILCFRNNTSNYPQRIANLGIPLVAGCFIAIVMFFVEYHTTGVISRSFRYFFQGNDRQYFALYFLDRGCSVLAILSCLVLLILTFYKRWVVAVIYYCIVLYLLKISDSLSSYLGFAVGGIIFLIMWFSRMQLSFLMIPLVGALTIGMPIFSLIQPPLELADKYSSIPPSGKHRLFIWKYTAMKAIEKPLFGWGFEAAKKFPIDEENDIIYYNQYKWSPLPLHPHNNILQMWLEEGLIGLILFAAVLVKLILTIIKLNRNQSSGLWGAFACSCLVNYLFIGMISYGVWQLWWVATAAFATVYFALFSGRVADNNVFSPTLYGSS